MYDIFGSPFTLDKKVKEISNQNSDFRRYAKFLENIFWLKTLSRRNYQVI
jgi:hypothetical protein